MAGDLNISTALNLSLNTLKNTDIENDEFHDSILEQFRVIINSCQKLTTTPNALLPPCLTELSEVLLKTLAKKIPPPLETATLGGVAFATVLSLVADASAVAMMYSKTFLYPRDDNSRELSVKLSKASETLQIKIEGSEETFRLTLCHGLLQVSDSFWNPTHVNWVTVLQGRMFPILQKHCLSYSRLSFLSFKTLVLWCMRTRSMLSNQICSSVAIKIMNIVASNWESPMNGVREQNFLLLEQLLLFTKIMDNSNPPEIAVSSPLQPQALLQLVITEMSWMMKSKYFFLAAILSKGNIKALQTHSSDIVYGLLTSLCYPHLASAGCDLYKVCIESISLDQWEQTFLKPIINVLTSSQYLLQKQNFFNYWLNPTIKKYKISLQIIYDSLLENKSSDILFPVVCCLKAGRKEGYESMKWSSISTSTYLSKGLRHCEEITRAHAFATVCHSTKPSVFPCDEEFQIVETFLTENINADSAPLRHSLISSFTIFLCRTRDACLQVLRTKFNQRTEPSNLDSRTLTRAMIFLEWLYNFLRSNLEIGSNYQRKTTSLSLYKVVLTHLSNESNLKKNSGKSDGQRVMKYAIAVGKWGFTSEVSRESLLYTITDENEEVRESAASLLINHFKMNENEGNRFKELFNISLTLCCDPMFYIADSGALLMYVITCLAYKNPSGDCKCLEIKEERVVSFLIGIAEKHVFELKTDILNAAVNGFPLYGVLRIIDRLINDKESPEFRKLHHTETLRLISLIENATQFLLQILASKSSNIQEYAPSFLEMGEAIESTVLGSSVNVEESDKHYLSPAYQLVLNTIWLNLKVCCSLASKLKDQPGCEYARCLTVITSVLKQTRHKGALESAGQALATLTKALTKDRKVEELEATLNEALDRLSVGQTQSTRGAGAIILIHRLVANDVRPDKPMLEKCLNQVLSLAERRKGDMAQALHLLGVLIRDSSMSQETARIIHKVAAACFNSLSHSSWAIRNTGLQLFGSIVPKLIGQRKQSEDDSACSCYHLSYEELYYHTPQLVNLILTQLEVGTSCSQKEVMSVHSKLVPLLTLVSNLSVGILTIIDRSIEEVFNKLVSCFQSLMSSPVFKVRQLAARSNAWFCSLSQLPSLIRTWVWKIVAYVNDRSLTNEIKSENGLHGFLLNTLYLYKRFQEQKEGVDALKRQISTVEESIEELRSIRYSLNVSFVCKSVLEEIVGYDRNVPVKEQISNLCVIPQDTYKALGYPIWVATASKQIIENCPLSEILPTLNSALETNNLELHISVLTSLKSRISKNDFEAVSNGTFTALLKFVNKTCLEEALEILLLLITKYKNLSTPLDLNQIIEMICNEKSNLSLTACCGLILLDRMPNLKMLNTIVSNLSEMSKPDRSEESRYYAAKGINLLSPIMLRSATHDSLKARSEIWLTAVNLLQDEKLEVRVEASKFANSIVEGPTPEETRNPFVSLSFLLNEKNISGLFPSQYTINCLWSQLKCESEEIDSIKIDQLNPFDSRDNNYQEQVKICDMTYDTILSLLEKSHEAKLYFLKEEVVPYVKTLRTQALQFLEFTEQNTSSKKTLLNASWYVVAKKLTLQFRIIEKLNHMDTQSLNMFKFRFQSYIELMLNPPTPV